MKLSFECDLEWDDLSGASSTQRHCGRCDRYVYNLSGMSKQRAAKLLAHHGEGLCVHFLSRDGRIVHDGDPLEQLRSQRTGARKLVAAALLVQAAFISIADDPAAMWFDPFRGVAEVLQPETVQETVTMGAMAVTEDVVF